MIAESARPREGFYPSVSKGRSEMYRFVIYSLLSISLLPAIIAEGELLKGSKKPFFQGQASARRSVGRHSIERIVDGPWGVRRVRKAGS